jgi:hypothetical protein
MQPWQLNLCVLALSSRDQQSPDHLHCPPAACLQRSPAWCDRVLWRSNLPFKQAKALDYFTAADIGTSDHKPVGAVLQVPTVRPATGDKAVNMVVQVSTGGHAGPPPRSPEAAGRRCSMI